MRVDFKSGNWVEMRAITELSARDKSVMSRATVVPVQLGLSQVSSVTSISMETLSKATYAVLGSLISSWSYDFMLPSADYSADDDGCRTYDESLMRMPIDDWNELEDVVEPYMDKLRAGGPKAGMTSSTSNGTSKAPAAYQKASARKH